MRPVNADAGFHKLDKLGELTVRLVVLTHGIEFIGLNDDVETGELRELVFAFFEARKAHFLPRTRGVGLLRGIDCTLKHAKFEQSAREAAPVAEGGVQKSSGLVQTFVEASVGDRLLIRAVRRSQKVFELGQIVDLGVRVHEFSIDARFFLVLAHHEQIRNHVFVHVSLARGVNDVDEITSILRLDVRLDGRFNRLRSANLKLCLTDLHPNFG